MKESSLLALKRNAILLGLCGEYKDKWDKCINKQDLVRLATDSNGIEFLADSIAFRWGLSVEYIKREFYDFLSNNKTYTITHKGYTSQLFVGVEKAVFTPCGTISLFAGCNCVIRLQNGFVGKIYVCGGSNITFSKCDDNENCHIELYVYGNNNNVDTKYAQTAKFERTDITKSLWVNHDYK